MDNEIKLLEAVVDGDSISYYGSNAIWELINYFAELGVLLFLINFFLFVVLLVLISIKK